MALFEGGPEPTTVAGWLAFVVTAMAGFWRTRLKVRRDSREDRESEVVADSYAAIIEQQRQRINDLANEFADMRREIHALRNELTTTRSSRDEAWLRVRDAESKVARLTSRIGVLEDQVKALQGS